MRSKRDRERERKIQGRPGRARECAHPRRIRARFVATRNLFPRNYFRVARACTWFLISLFARYVAWRLRNTRQCHCLPAVFRVAIDEIALVSLSRASLHTCEHTLRARARGYNADI